MRKILAAAMLLLLAGCASSQILPATSRAAFDSASVAEGARLYSARGCASCHSIDGTRRVGPTWKALYGSRVELEGGRTVEADEQYLAESIGDPDAQTVKGFPRGVMASAIKPGSIPDSEVQALVAYIRTLK